MKSFHSYPKFVYSARLAKRSNGKHAVYDADTVHLDVDCGFGIIHKLGACRLYGIDAPEMRGPERKDGIVSRDWMRDQLEQVDEFIIESFKDAKGKYGRYLVRIFIETSDGRTVCLNDELVERGLARAAIY